MSDDALDRYLDEALTGRLLTPDAFVRREGLDAAVAERLRGAHARLLDPPEPGPVRGKLGRYLLEEPLGKGGYGEVFRARDEAGEVCAIKVLRGSFQASSAGRLRFAREAAAVQRLDHPGIVRLREVGEADGRWFLAFDLVPGRTLRERVRERLPPVGRALAWALALGEALAAVHRAGLIHRDVKPANVMITPEDRPVLLDFGLALDTVATLTRLTVGFVGTPAYAPAEQRGSGLVSARTDLYSLAATTYFALTGRAPYGPRPRWKQPPAALSLLRPGLPATLDALLLAALDPDPAARPGSVEAWCEQLRRLAGSLDDTVRPAEPRTRERWEALLSGAEDATLLRTYRDPSGDEVRERDPSPPFELGEAIGSGGQGVVFRGRQRRLDRTVAIKVVRAGTEEPGAFLAEALLAGRLEHPNILPVYDLLRDADQSSVQLAMKLVEGRSWAERLRTGRRDLGAEVETLIALCNAVAFSHSRGVVHNDLKPANVLLGPYGEVLLCDWGIAVALFGEATGIRPRSVITGAWGTPAYLSPELARGDVEALTVRSDVYELGAILHELLCGRPPNDRARFLALLVERVPEPLRFPDDAPEPLRELCEQALALDPSARPASAEVFRDRLRDYLRNRESLTLTRAAEERLRGVGQGSTYAEYAEIVASFRQARLLWEGNERARAGERSARIATARAALAGGDLGLAENQLELADDGGGDEAILRLRAQVTARVARRRRDRKLRAGLVLGLVIATAALFFGLLAHIGIVEGKNDLLAARGAIAEEALYTSSHDVVEVLRGVGDAATTRAIERILRATESGWVRLRDAHLAEDRTSLGAAVTRTRLAELRIGLERDLDLARGDLTEAIAVLRGLRAEDPAAPGPRRALAEALFERGSLSLTRFDLPATRADLLAARGLWAGLAAEEPSASAREAKTLVYLATAATHAGDFPAAEAYLSEALVLYEGGDPGRLNSEVAWLCAEQATILGNQGRLESALALLDKAVAVFRSGWRSATGGRTGSISQPSSRAAPSSTTCSDNRSSRGATRRPPSSACAPWRPAILATCRRRRASRGRSSASRWPSTRASTSSGPRRRRPKPSRASRGSRRGRDPSTSSRCCGR